MKIKLLMPVLVMSAVLGQTAVLQAARSDDTRIVSSAKQTYVYKTYLKNDHVKIQCTDGNVILTGEVMDPSHKALAEDTVRGLPGVNQVDNQIVYKGEDAANVKSDGWVELKVKSTLLFHRSVSAGKTKVAVKDGTVTLTGTATSQAQKDLTSEYANDVDGVRGVNNMITVINPPENSTSVPSAPSEPSGRTLGQKMDDASITAEVKSALMAHRSTSAIRTEVRTHDGMVTVSGAAKNQAEKDLVSKLVNDIRGVRSVENDMTVQ